MVKKVTQKGTNAAEKKQVVETKTAPKIQKDKKKKEATTTSGASKISRRFNKLRVKAGELDKKGVVYVGHLPKGFNEAELKKFFEQFGSVPKLRVSRSKKVCILYHFNQNY